MCNAQIGKASIREAARHQRFQSIYYLCQFRINISSYIDVSYYSEEIQVTC